jgi:aminoglycoside phosphotransferase (APT) family kinase protein
MSGPGVRRLIGWRRGDPPPPRGGQVPLLGTADKAAVIAAAADEDRGLDLTGAELDGAGYENLVLRTADGWILRFPRRAEPDFDREVAVLRRLAGTLPVPIPDVAWTGTRHRVMAYRAVDGDAFEAAAYEAAEPRTRDRLAASLARFLVVMHSSLSTAEIAELGIPAADHAGQVELVRDRMDRVPARLRAGAERVLDEFAAAWPDDLESSSVLLHNDFHLLNMVFTGPAGELTGVWDFSCVRTGPPGLDLRYFARVPQSVPLAIRRDLLSRLAEQYGRTGITLDPEAARAAMAMEDLVDGVLSDDPGKIEAATDPSYG